MCYYCHYNEHGMCLAPTAQGSSLSGEPFLCCCNEKDQPVIIEGGEKRGPGRPQLSGDAMENVLSAGRHRAQRALPNIANTPCQWRGLLYAGGGVVPIVGCSDGLIDGTDYGRHHGPNKSVLDNTVGVNLHGLCTSCHNRWHALNDEYYGKRPPNGEPFIPLEHEMKAHDPKTRATELQLIQHQLWWDTKKKDRGPYDSVRTVTSA